MTTISSHNIARNGSMAHAQNPLAISDLTMGLIAPDGTGCP